MCVIMMDDGGGIDIIGEYDHRSRQTHKRDTRQQKL